MKLTPYYAHRIFLSYHQHFLGKLDLTKYKGNFLRPPEDKFYENSLYFVYKHLTDNKIKNEKSWKSICIISHLKNKTIYIREIAEQFNYYETLANNWESYHDTLSYNLEKDFRRIFRLMEKEKISFNRHLGPWLLKKFTSHKIGVESFYFLLKTLKISLDGNIDYEYLFKEPFERYLILIEYDPDKVRKILEKVIIGERR